MISLNINGELHIMLFQIEARLCILNDQSMAAAILSKKKFVKKY